MVSKEVIAIVDQLKRLDLKTENFEQVKSLISTLKPIPMLLAQFPTDLFIVRNRPDTDEANVFKNPQDISYISNPSQILAFNRASAPGKPIFYGCIRNEEFNDRRRSEDACYALSVFETNSELQGPPLSSNETRTLYSTMGKWRIRQPLNLVIIAHKKDFQEKNPVLKRLHDHYETSIKTRIDCEDILFVADYFSEEFGKEVSRNERYGYKISAAMSELLFERGVDGIIYPSVKGTDLGFNVALVPKVLLEKKVIFEKALIWKIQIRGRDVVQTSWLYCDQLNSSGGFIWRDAGPYHSQANSLWNGTFES